MPYVNGKYTNPVWVNDGEPAIDEDNLNDLSNAVADLSSNSPQNATITLTAAGWAVSDGDYAQTVSVTGVIADTAKQNVLVSPTPTKENIANVGGYTVYCSAQRPGGLTFISIGDKPTVDLQYNIQMIGIGGG